MSLTHFNEDGRAKMVSVDGKDDTLRTAVAIGTISLKKELIDLIRSGDVKKGDVLGVAQIAGIMAAKKTSDIIPMCHNINLTGVDLSFEIDDERRLIIIEATAKTVGKTGVEMEALSAVSIAALTIYDMCKAYDKEMVISNIELLHKSGGKSGDYNKED